MSSLPLTTLTISDQKLPEPTAAGMASDPSNSTTGAVVSVVTNC